MHLKPQSSRPWGIQVSGQAEPTLGTSRPQGHLKGVQPEDPSTPLWPELLGLGPTTSQHDLTLSLSFAIWGLAPLFLYNLNFILFTFWSA